MRASHIIMFLAAFVLVGCGNEELQDLRDFVKNSGADMRGKVEPPPEIIVYEPFSYSTEVAIPDPFKPRKADPKNAGNAGVNQPNLDRSREELEEFPLESLKMVGYLRRADVDYAIVRSTDGKLHRVKAGNYMGLDFGKIFSISDAEIKIEEMVQDSGGDWSERASSLQLVE
ncbi:MAG: pilus assembly protein PilP [Gallionellaceae bacterium]